MELLCLISTGQATALPCLRIAESKASSIAAPESAAKNFGINFALALPNQWNGDFLMQGGGGSNGKVFPPLGLNAAGDTPGLMRGFAVVSTDTGHKSERGFDFGFMRDQRAYLDFAYLANAEVADPGQTTGRAILREGGSLFVFLRMFHRRPRRHDSFATLPFCF